MRIRGLPALLAILILLSSLSLYTSPKALAHDVQGPYVDFLVLKVYGSPADALQSVLRGDADIAPLQVSPDELAELKTNPGIKIAAIPDFGFTYIGMNLRDWPFNSSAFRQAMMYGFNRVRILNEQLLGLGEILGPGLFSSAYAPLGWQSSDLPGVTYDSDRAKQLLDSTGFTLGAGSEFRIDPKTKNRLRGLFIYSQLGNPFEVSAAEAFAGDMRSLGLPVYHLPQSAFDFGTLVRQTYNFDLFIDSEPASSAPLWLDTLFTTRNDIAPAPLGSNRVGYRSGQFDFCASRLLGSTNIVDAQRAAQDCQKQLALDLPVLPVYSKHLLLAVRPSISDLVSSVVGSIPATIRQSSLNIKIDGKVGGELRVAVVSDFANLDPTSTGSASDWLLLSLVTEPLLNLGQDGTLTAGLATEWAVEDNGRSVRFVFADIAKFRTGEEVTTQNIAATIDWLRANVKSSSKLYGTIRLIERTEAVDKATLRITLTQPNSFAVELLAGLFAFPASRLIAGAGNFLRSRVLVSSGPFTLEELKSGELARLRYNDNYFLAPADRPAVTEQVEVTQGELLFGTRVTSGTQITLETPPVMFRGLTVENANYTVSILTEKQDTVLSSAGTYKSDGVYSASLSTDAPGLEPGNYRIETLLYAETAAGTVAIFDDKHLVVKAASPFIFITLTVVIVAVAAAAAALILIRKRKPT